MYPLLPFSLNQPLAVDNAISTIGAIHKLIGKINEVIEEVNNIDSTANQYTDEQIALLKSELQINFNELETLIASLSDRIDVTDSQIQGIFSELTDLRNIMNTNFYNIYNRINEVNTSLTLQIQDNYIVLYNYINSQIDMIEQLINAMNPEIIDCFGNKNKLQVAYNKMFSCLKYALGEGRFDRVLNLMKTFTFSTHVNMQNVTFSAFITGVQSASTTKYLSYYLSYGDQSIQVYTPRLETYKELITNINSAMLLILKFSFSVIPNTEQANLYKAIRNTFLTDSEYQSTIMLNTLKSTLRY